jgi:hypothetical protein
VHVDEAAIPKLEAGGIRHAASRYPGLVLVESELDEEELFANLAAARVVPRRVEPRASVLSIYLDATRKERER